LKIDGISRFLDLGNNLFTKNYKIMATVNSYLTFNGNCEEAFNFYKKVFGGDFSYVGRYSEMPVEEGNPEIPEAEKGKIMHIGLPISKETSLMGCDSIESLGERAKGGTNFSIYLNTDRKAEADKLFEELAEGGKVTMPLADTFWGSYFGMLKDKFGISWMVGFDEDENQ